MGWKGSKREDEIPITKFQINSNCPITKQFIAIEIWELVIIDDHLKTQKNVAPAPIFIGINSSRSPDDVPAKAGNHLKTLDSHFHGNDDKGPNWTFYETIII